MEQYTQKTAFLEFGSTSIKFYILKHGPNGESLDEKVPWDLGYDVFGHGRISPRSISHCLRTLEEWQKRFPEIPFDSVTSVGTSALREAQNVEVLQRVLWDQLKIKIRIIEGGIEAFLLETGFRNMIEEFPTGLFDLGGGSLELIEYLSPSSTRKTSTPVGAVRIHCQLRRTRDLFEYIREGRRVAERSLRQSIIPPLPVYPQLIGTGGTVRAIVQCIGKDNFVLGDVQDLIEREVHGPVWPDLKPHRRKLLLPGILAVEALFSVFGVECIHHRKASVKSGLISFTSMLPSGV